MDKVTILINHLKQKTPFCFIKMNDGEMNALINPNAGLSRGLDKSSELMSQKLKEALTYEQENYYVGIPCEKCYKNLNNETNKYIEKKNKDYILYANIFINSNMNISTKCLQTCFQDERKKIIVCNEKMASNIDNLRKFGIPIDEIYIVSDKFAFQNDYASIVRKINDIPENSVILTCCGPLGRILCKEWFEKNKSLTCLELGSYFDPLLNNRSYMYHTGNLLYCDICNPSQNASNCDLMKYAQKNIDNECFYFNQKNETQCLMHHFQQNKEKVYQNYKLRLEKNKNDHHALDYIQNYDKDKIEKDKVETLKRYKKMSKTQLYNEAAHLYYNCKDEKKCELASNLYLEYFGHLNEKESKKMLFFNGFSYFHSNKQKAIESFEKLYNDPDCPKEDVQFTEWNLDLLYPKNNKPIPKIIHLIYFKERELQLYHYGCIMSMIEHLPDYEFRLYNDKEPENNKYWNELKKNSKIKIIKYERPIEFDGFHLSHVQYAADVTRLELLYEYGGVYLDLDILIFKDFTDFISKKDLYISYEGDNKGPLINSFLASKPKNEFLKLWLNSFKCGLRMEKWAYHIAHSNKQLLEKNKCYFIKHKIEIIESKYFFNYPWPHYDKFHNIEKYREDFMFGLHLFDTIHHGLLKNNKYFQKYQLDEIKKTILEKQISISKTKYGDVHYYNTDLYISQDLKNNRLYEENIIMNDLKPYIKKSKIILDIGAHIGCHSIGYSSIQHDAQIYSFEPQKQLFDLLEKNCEIKNNIHVFNQAVGAFNGSCTIPDTIEQEDNKHFSYEDEKSYNYGGIGIGEGNNEVEMVTIDSLKLEGCDFIKIDVEGFEYFVLKGAEETIKKYKPVIFYEENGKVLTPYMKKINHCENKTDKELNCKDYLESLGYNKFENKWLNILASVEHKTPIQPIIKKVQIKTNEKYLVYSCVFFNEKYINLLGLLLRSYHLFGFDESIQYVIFTNKEFEPKVRSLCESLGFSFDIWVLDLNTFFESAYCRLMIFDYPHIQDYSKILYLDCDVLIGNCIKPLYDVANEDLLYTLKENTTKDKNHGAIFFDKDFPETSTFTSGVLLFKNCEKIKQLFIDILNHIHEYLKTHSEGPGCLDQPFIIYHALTKKMYNNELLEGLVINNPKEIKNEIVYHFPSLVGVYETKIHYMNDFFKKITDNVKKSIIEFDKLNNQKYIWGNNPIDYLENGLMNAWGRGKYFFIKNNLIQADFGGQCHLIRFYDDYKKYISVRKKDFEIIQGERIENNLVKIKHLL